MKETDNFLWKRITGSSDCGLQGRGVREGFSEEVPFERYLKT